jgi:hypothetical protein
VNFLSAAFCPSAFAALARESGEKDVDILLSQEYKMTLNLGGSFSELFSQE